MCFLHFIVDGKTITLHTLEKMALANDVLMPTDAELTVPQEITLSTPWFKAVAVYMNRNCEAEIKASSGIYLYFILFFA